ncbi:FadR/GntR family transcriptional regulator [Flexivirga caeni]|uniref:FadR/GntR family transcriptional regulator n=1 Tax=Flexivirga caeni TaxID=2294115 RepID=UPI001FECB8AA|nr:FCD domain-containing protein [Flexivirga caeni]
MTAERLDRVVLRPIRAHHAFEACVEQLAIAIRLGIYPPGSMLPPERDLAELLAVSRATLREAISALRSAGVVRTRRGRGGGTEVLDAAPATGRRGLGAIIGRVEDLRDALEFRAIVEPGAAGLAAARCARDEFSSDDRAALTAALDAVDRAPDEAIHRRADSILHLTVARLSGSTRLITAVTDAQDDLHTMLQAIPVLPRNIKHSSTQHRAIVAAIFAGNESRANRVMHQHCSDTAALLRGLLG